MKFRFALIVGLLFLTSSVCEGTTEADTSTEPADTTTAADVDTTVDGTTVASDGTTVLPDGTTKSAGLTTEPNAGSTDAPASTVSPDSTVSSGPTVSVNPSDVPASTVTNAPISTIAASTVSSAPTTLPDVPVSLVQFGSPVCVNSTCTYEFDAPVNNQALLATDQSIIDTDRTQYGILQNNASSVDSRVKKANDDAVAKIAQIQKMIDDIQENLDSIQNLTNTITSQQETAATNIYFVENFISSISMGCLWERCLKPTTPAPPTTTPTPEPTTTQSPCVTYNCSLALDDKTCQLDSQNKPYCKKCPGDMNGYSDAGYGCTTVACSPSGTPFNTDANGNGTWYSFGYSSNSSVNPTVPANSNCVYQLTGTFTSADGLNLTCLTSGNVKISFSSNDGSFTQPIASGTTKRALDSLLKKIPDGVITLTSTSADSTFCQIPLSLLKPTPSPATVEVEEKKKNGFFSWLMGY